LLQSLPYLAQANARLLVLGSMPGAVSLQHAQYYAHPRNQFWRLLFATFGVADPRTYADRVAFLHRQCIALWDVLATCEREGSLDARIVAGSERPNDIASFLRAHAEIRAIALNGGKAAALFRRLVMPLEAPIEILAMPSTSPAHTQPFAAKLQRWRQAFDIVSG